LAKVDVDAGHLGLDRDLHPGEGARLALGAGALLGLRQRDAPGPHHDAGRAEAVREDHARGLGGLGRAAPAQVARQDHDDRGEVLVEAVGAVDVPGAGGRADVADVRLAARRVVDDPRTPPRAVGAARQAPHPQRVAVALQVAVGDGAGLADALAAEVAAVFA